LGRALVKYGLVRDWYNRKRESIDISISLPVKVHFYQTGITQYGLIQYTVDPRGTCYHRFFAESPAMEAPIEGWLASQPEA